MTWRQLLGRVTAGLYAGVFNLVAIVLVVLYALGQADGRIVLQPETSDPERAASQGQLVFGTSGEQVRDVLWFALICGVAAFATIEILKRIFALRGIYQLRQTRIWLGDRLPGAKRGEGSDQPFRELLSAMGLRGRPGGGFLQWLDLTEERQVFNLPTEQLAAQVSAAADVALTAFEPAFEPGLEPGLESAHEHEYEYEYAAFLGGLAGIDPKEVEKRLSGELPPQRRDAVDPRVELTQRVRTGVDQLQISIGERWRRLLQGAALWIAGFYGGVLARDQGELETLYVLSALVIGGLFAWIVRDLAAVLERSRR
jgi:hypothetical protein